jgi:hypothetical protein
MSGRSQGQTCGGQTQQDEVESQALAAGISDRYGTGS